MIRAYKMLREEKKNPELRLLREEQQQEVDENSFAYKIGNRIGGHIIAPVLVRMWYSNNAFIHRIAARMMADEMNKRGNREELEERWANKRRENLALAAPVTPV